jgi:hypothetical protein
MKLNQYAKPVTLGVLIVSLLGSLVLMVSQLPAKDNEAPSASEPSKLAKGLIGTWVLAGTPDNVGEPPAAGGRLKFFTGRHWAITQADPNTGVVTYHHGGTYTLNGDELIETVKYANENTAYLINRDNKFKVKVEGDTYTQVGIGNSWNEVWKRAKLGVPTPRVLGVRSENQASTGGADADLAFSNPANLGPTVNSADDEYDPSISADRLELYFNSYRSGGLGQADLWVTTRKTKADPWGSPVNLGPTVNSPAGDKAPCISADGLSLYFSSGRSGGHGDQDLWVTTRKTKNAPWGEPVNLGPTVNSEAGEHSPSISTDGLTLYFAEQSEKLDRPGGLGGGDIWVTMRKTKADPWASPVNLGPTVNSPAWDQAPSISDDGLTLYFDSERDGVDESAIWVTRRKATSEPWGAPVRLGPAVNAGWEADPDISRDGSTLYFVSGRSGGSGGTDLWQLSLRKQAVRE